MRTCCGFAVELSKKKDLRRFKTNPTPLFCFLEGLRTQAAGPTDDVRRSMLWKKCNKQHFCRLPSRGGPNMVCPQFWQFDHVESCSSENSWTSGAIQGYPIHNTSSPHTTGSPPATLRLFPDHPQLVTMVDQPWSTHGSIQLEPALTGGYGAGNAACPLSADVRSQPYHAVSRCCKGFYWSNHWSKIQNMDDMDAHNCLVVSTPLKNISQLGWLYSQYMEK